MAKVKCTVVIKATHPRSRMHKRKDGSVSIWGIRGELSDVLWASHGKCERIVVLNGMKLHGYEIGSDRTARFAVIGSSFDRKRRR